MTTVRRARPTATSCHGAPAAPRGLAGAPHVALAGAPNVGKSTLFNLLCGTRREVGNWPGTTVEVGRGAWTAGRPVQLVDLPGAYSLDPLSPDERLTQELLAGDLIRPDLVVVVVSAAHLARSLYLVAQLRERARRLVVALTMLDVAAARGTQVDAQALGTAIGVPVVALHPRAGSGAAQLTEVVAAALAGPPVPARVGVPGPGADELSRADDRFAWVAAAVSAATCAVAAPHRSRSDRIDRWAVAPVVGPLAFLATMWAVFQVTTRVAAPLQSALGSVVTGPVAGGAQRLLGWLHLDGTWVARFVIDGLVAGVGLVLTFVPLMALMFALLALLDDSGYLARAAVVTDSTMRRIGLPGRAFLPLVVGFGCNVPAIVATRVLPDARHRRLTALLVPFTSCSARLTVYVLVASTFFPGHAGDVAFAMYALSVVLVVAVGLALRGTLFRVMSDEPLVLDLPAYQRPSARLVTITTWLRLRGFLRSAGGIIVAAVAVVWLLQAVPVTGPGSFADVPVDDSLYAATARAAAPVFAPAGFGDWHASGALLVGSVAKEAVVASWAQTYAAQHPADLRHPGALGRSVHADFVRSSHGHPGPAALAFLVFLLAYTPCVATLAAQGHEIGWRWTLVGVALQLSVAWGLAVLVFQAGRGLG